METTKAGAKLKQLRKKAGLSQKEAAAKLGLTPNSLYFWESDRTFPKPDLWDHLIAMYKVERDEFIRLAGGEASPRVRRYLEHQERQTDSNKKNERSGKRIYLRSKTKNNQPSGTRSAAVSEQQGQALLLQRIADLERKVAEMESSTTILERAGELLRAWEKFQKALKAG